MNHESQFFEELISRVKSERPSKHTLSQLKLELCKKHHIKNIPTDIEILMQAGSDDFKALKRFLVTKPTRTGSGVSVVAVMTKPFPCPHGKCIYCPGGVRSEFGDVPQSYTGKEPATMRGIRHNYDPYSIIFNRLEQYLVMGQSCQKAELIIMGGTFLSFPKEYKEKFIFLCFRALNDFSRLFFDAKGSFILSRFKDFFELPGKVGDKSREESIRRKVLALEKIALEKINSRDYAEAIGKEQRKNERSFVKCVGLTVETRPDYGMKKHGDELLSYGCTRVELGVQSVYDDVLKKINRGHTVNDSIESTGILRDMGFKINYHLMPGLPGADKKKDIEGLKEIFRNRDFRPDMLKIYPCMVMPGTQLHQEYKRGRFKPLATADAAEIILEFKKSIPRYVRIMRVQRDIPTKATAAGVGMTNLRQQIEMKARAEGSKKFCECIRCREIKDCGKIGEPMFEIIGYDAGHGKEFFISLASQDDRIIGFCRLRFPSGSKRKEISKEASLIRELHVYGSAAGFEKSDDDKKRVQHQGFGGLLLQKAESIARQHHKKKMVVISGVGVRGYYRKHGYHLEGPYMVKRL